MIAEYAYSYPTGLTQRDISSLSLEELYRVHDDVLRSFLCDYESQRVEKRSGDELSLLELKQVILEKQLSETCRLCARSCSRRPGFCKVRTSRIAAIRVVYEDESFFVPNFGIFFTGCNLRCRFCQSWDIAFYPDNGRVVDVSQVVEDVKFALEVHGELKFIKLSGGEPTLHLPYILRLVRELVKSQIRLDIAAETNLMVTESTLKLLVGVFDLFIVDVKTGEKSCAATLLEFEQYPEVLRRNLSMLRDMKQRVHLRHLLLPGHVNCCTRSALKLVRELGLNAKLTLLTTYTPPVYISLYGKAELEVPVRLTEDLANLLRRSVSKKEIEIAREIAADLGLDFVIV
jgi:putative pyruvate formate lyase activating enzyme